jgi:hypothetical protein
MCFCGAVTQFCADEEVKVNIICDCNCFLQLLSRIYSSRLAIMDQNRSTRNEFISDQVVSAVSAFLFPCL